MTYTWAESLLFSLSVMLYPCKGVRAGTVLDVNGQDRRLPPGTGSGPQVKPLLSVLT